MLALGEDIEIIGASLPEARRKLGLPERYLIQGLPLSSAAAGDTLFQDLHGHSDSSFCRFADQEMDVLRHDDIAPDHELVLLSDFLQDLEKEVAAARRSKEGMAMITTAGDEVLVAAGVKTFQTFRHGESL